MESHSKIEVPGSTWKDPYGMLHSKQYGSKEYSVLVELGQ